jgi:hypothetical protein
MLLKLGLRLGLGLGRLGPRKGIGISRSHMQNSPNQLSRTTGLSIETGLKHKINLAFVIPKTKNQLFYQFQTLKPFWSGQKNFCQFSHYHPQNYDSQIAVLKFPSSTFCLPLNSIFEKN